MAWRPRCRSTSRSRARRPAVLRLAPGRRDRQLHLHPARRSKWAPTTPSRCSAPPTQPAGNFFTDGAPLTGQSDHLVNLQFGFESSDRLSQQTLLLSYASDRVTSRGAAGLPGHLRVAGLTVDLVAREGFNLFGQDLEMKLEGRNLTRRGYSEFQERSGSKVYYNRYDVGASFSLSVTAKF